MPCARTAGMSGLTQAALSARSPGEEGPGVWGLCCWEGLRIYNKPHSPSKLDRLMVW